MWLVGGCVGASLRGWRSRSPDDGSCLLTRHEDLDMADATFSCPDLTTFLGLDALGLLAVGGLLGVSRTAAHNFMRTAHGPPRPAAAVRTRPAARRRRRPRRPAPPKGRMGQESRSQSGEAEEPGSAVEASTSSSTRSASAATCR